MLRGARRSSLYRRRPDRPSKGRSRPECRHLRGYAVPVYGNVACPPVISAQATDGDIRPKFRTMRVCRHCNAVLSVGLQ